MTVCVETDFLLTLAKDSDWLQGAAEEALGEHEVETSAFSCLELVLARERHEFDYVPLVANLVGPLRDEEEKQVVLRAVNYHDEGMTPFEAFHAATAETRGTDPPRRGITRTSGCRDRRWNRPTRSDDPRSALCP